MGLIQNNSKDEVAFNLVLLQLSSEGKTFEEMNKYMIKNQRMKRVIEKNFETKCQQVQNKFERDYIKGGNKDRIKNIFNSIV